MYLGSIAEGELSEREMHVFAAKGNHWRTWVQQHDNKKAAQFHCMGVYDV